jgi:hypothetical protein
MLMDKKISCIIDIWLFQLYNSMIWKKKFLLTVKRA